MDTETDYEGQLDPELLAYIEAQRAAEDADEPETPEQDDPDPETAALMEEPPGGWNLGRASSAHSAPGGSGDNADEDDRSPTMRRGRILDARVAANLEGVGEGENDVAHVVDAQHGRAATGLVAHRGAIVAGEYVDRIALLAALEDRLGASAELMRELYGGRAGGPLRAGLRELRAAVDVQIAEIADHGGSLRLLAQWLGITNERALQRGAERGRRAN
jgi:hypothetical protein